MKIFAVAAICLLTQAVELPEYAPTIAFPSLDGLEMDGKCFGLEGLAGRYICGRFPADQLARIQGQFADSLRAQGFGIHTRREILVVTVELRSGTCEVAHVQAAGHVEHPGQLYLLISPVWDGGCPQRPRQ